MAPSGLTLGVAPLAMLLLAGCPPGSTTYYGTAGGGTGNPGSPAASTGGGGGTSTGGAGAASTGTPNPPSPYVDGGYVFCALPSAADAGPHGDGGSAAWLCQPGTTLCDPSGEIGSCFQCASDGDCANRSLPGYDARRPRCDLRSKVPGYQGFCQECVDNADCAGNPAGPLCDLNPDYPPGALVSDLEIGGFEACGDLITDCRLDGGPVCDGPNQVCDSDGGLCVTRLNICTTDGDCDGLLSFYLPIPYCLDGGYCSSCPGGLCPEEFEGCRTSADCENPDGGRSGLICKDFRCGCTSSASCGGYWPVCEGLPDGGADGGESFGLCGCDADWQCGDGGLSCLPYIFNPYEAAAGFCGVPCTSPRFPACASLLLEEPICDSRTGLCTACTTDAECQAGVQTGGPVCFPSGVCGCDGDAGCPGRETCQLEQNTCAVGLSRCVRGSCPEDGFCNWDSGSCEPFPSDCLVDSDCDFSEPFCEEGQCVDCRADPDCRKIGLAAAGYSSCVDGSCLLSCRSDSDCLGNGNGPACVERSSGYATCGCTGDVDCTGNLAGPRCDSDAGDPSFETCGCRSSLDCGPGEACFAANRELTFGHCLPGCTLDSDCPSDTYCDSRGSCRPRCDIGHICVGNELLCDHQNVAVQNGDGVTWCYQCLTGDDCGGTAGCNLEVCGPCSYTAQCASGRVCVGGSCQPRCQAGQCPGEGICDVLGVGGYGADLCLPCVTAADCSDGLGCNQATHVCGTCLSPNRPGVPPVEGFDCPPSDLCSSYWVGGQTGVCLANCDLRSCPASQPRCEVIPSLTPDHRYCVGCLHDSDCADAGPGAWCDVSVNFTFSCQPLVR